MLNIMPIVYECKKVQTDIEKEKGLLWIVMILSFRTDRQVWTNSVEQSE